jgi:2'-5' RNA ligase
LDFSGMADLSEVREKFLENSHTIKNVRQDFQQWHQGRLRYALWAIDVDCQAVRQQVSAAEQRLEEFLLRGYFRQPHITLGISGFLSSKPLSDKAQLADDYVSGRFAADVAALKNLGMQPFEIEIGVLASFSSAPFFHVNDPTSSLHQLHACLHTVASDANFQYVPHVTVGLYSEAWSTEIVSNHLDTFSHDSVATLLINRISLMSYAAAEIGGALVTIADYDLARAEIRWHEPPPFNHGL